MSPRVLRFAGSSPLARGLLNEDVLNEKEVRIIPARAGFTCRSRTAWCARADHPRSRGVYGSGGGPVIAVGGSSPLARGLRVIAVDAVRLARIIPARAGFTGVGGHPHQTRRDHPRSRGVYLFSDSPETRNMGSSPLARGLLAYFA